MGGWRGRVSMAIWYDCLRMSVREAAASGMVTGSAVGERRHLVRVRFRQSRAGPWVVRTDWVHVVRGPSGMGSRSLRFWAEQ